ncbi:hypothetical protein R1sor_007817 [Riccia sorocarpa]|uniref:Stress-response A/B barrel domain-containing protein n=1 Tax=Riccia sorocarpa TaxID=122646 RepID=A0ABD3HVQ2_9MARC
MAGTIKHLLLLKFKDDLTEDKKQQLIEGYEALPSKIDVMKGFEWGTDLSVENFHQGYTHVFISTFDSTADRDAYLSHEKHQEYAADLLANIEKVLVVDFAPRVVPIPATSS